jgi:type VI secretion system protein
MALEQPDPALAELTPAGVHRILGGGSEGVETRATGAVVGEAQRWLGSLPKGAAEQVMHQPMGWAEPPSTQQSLLPPDFDQPVSDFANRSEHLAGINTTMSVPQAQQILPADWLGVDDSAPSPAAVPQTPPPLRTDGKFGRGRADRFEANEARQILADGARVDPTTLGDAPNDVLLRRCGETLRVLLDGLDSLEAAQAVAERDCGLSAPTQIGAQSDFFASSSDPIPALLSASESRPAELLAHRLMGLADRQRALGRAVAQALDSHKAERSPAQQHAGGRSKAKAWALFRSRRADPSAEPDETTDLHVILRKAFADALVRES